MRKLVLGILAVICVQFAFVIYTAWQSPVDVAIGPIYRDPQIAYTEPPPSDSDANEAVTQQSEELDPVIKSESNVHPVRRIAASTRSAERRLPEPRAEPLTKPTAEVLPAVSEPRSPAGAFETVVIRYDRDPAISDCEIEKVPKPKKRSYIAKAAPVIKKPWEWLKSIGSKLN